MSEDVVKIKGSKSGLQLVFDEAADFAAIEKEIREKLESGSNFFCRGTIMQVLPGQLVPEEQETLMKLFRQYGVLLRAAAEEPPESPAAEPAAATVEPTPQPAAGDPKISQQEMLVVDRTIRGGQEITSQGSVLICGNVNPGSQVIAGGSIDIRGTCRGMVHAGAYGDTTAFIIADHLMPVQIRIGDLIARAPDHMEKSSRAEKAFIRNGQIVIEPIER